MVGEISLTTRQRDLLLFIQGYQSQHGYSPSYLEMLAAMGLVGKAAIFRLLSGLEERGFIRRIPRRARAIEILRPAAIQIKGRRYRFISAASLPECRA